MSFQRRLESRISLINHDLQNLVINLSGETLHVFASLETLQELGKIEFSDNLFRRNDCHKLRKTKEG